MITSSLCGCDTSTLERDVISSCQEIFIQFVVSVTVIVLSSADCHAVEGIPVFKRHKGGNVNQSDSVLLSLVDDDVVELIGWELFSLGLTSHVNS